MLISLLLAPPLCLPMRATAQRRPPPINLWALLPHGSLQGGGCIDLILLSLSLHLNNAWQGAPPHLDSFKQQKQNP